MWPCNKVKLLPRYLLMLVNVIQLCLLFSYLMLKLLVKYIRDMYNLNFLHNLHIMSMGGGTYFPTASQYVFCQAKLA